MRHRYLTAVPAIVAVLLLLGGGAACAEIVKGPYLQEVTTTGVTVKWESANSGPPCAPGVPGVVEYGGTGALGSTVEAADLGGGLRSARLTGLAPGKAYYYRAVEGAAASLTYPFRTLPRDGAFTFAVYGDTRSVPSDHAVVCASMSGKGEAFVLHVGDLVGDGGDQAQWGPQFFEPAGPLAARFAIFAAAGNHERESADFYRYFGSSTGKPWYSFDCSNAHFIVLDTCLDCGPRSEQYKWLEADLAKTEARWRFITFHHPLFSSGSHGSEWQVRESIWPLIEKYDVDMIFAGHDHHYERTRPVMTTVGSWKSHPVTHVLTGGGGAPHSAPRGDFFTAASTGDLNFCAVKVDGDRLEFTAYTAQGIAFDRFTVVKFGQWYAGTYPTDAFPIQAAYAEALARRALVQRTFEYSGGDRVLAVPLEFAAPEVTDVRLVLSWRGGEKGARVVPERSEIFIPRRGIETLDVELMVPGGATACPSVSVEGESRFGRFRFEASPFAISPKAAQRK